MNPSLAARRRRRLSALAASLAGWLVLPALLSGSALAAEPAALPDPAAVEFTRDVVPVLTRSGCSSGACHGSFQGRGGLQLSLLGFDPQMDYEALALQARGRRVNAAAPAESLLLRKPTLDVPHGGGQRLEIESEAYAVLLAWVSQGLKPPAPGDPQLLRIETSPAELLLQVGDRSQLSVAAYWSDGVVRDVTRWAHFESRLPQTAEVDSDGLVQATSSGATSLTVRFLDRLAAVPVSVPFVAEGGALPSDFVPVNEIDRLVAQRWQELGCEVAPLCDDAEFLRRVSLDLTGTLPTPEAAREFLASTDPQKRAVLIDQLLQRPEYVEFWALRWCDLLRIHRRALGEKGLWSFQGWIRQALRENRGLDQVVRELLTAQGNLYTQGPVAYFFIDKTPQEMAETTAQLFLGVRMQCARCHHHPFEVWSQDDYYGLAAFFTGFAKKDTREGGSFGGSQTVRVVTPQPLANPATGLPAVARPLGGAAFELAPGDDLRRPLAEWIAAPENPFFARNLVNRYWQYLFGRGLVDPADDVRATNPPTHPELLTWLADDFVQHGFDAQHLLRTICNSSVYQRASDPAAQRDLDGALYTHYVVRRLPAEVLLDAINQAALTREAFDGLPPGTRAISLPDSTVNSYFLDTFGRPQRTNVCLCARVERPDLRQALHLSNSDALHAKVTSAEGRVAQLLAAQTSPEQAVEELYLATLTRLPDDAERQLAWQFVQSAPSVQEGLQDLLWTLVNTTEFFVQH